MRKHTHAHTHTHTRNSTHTHKLSNSLLQLHVAPYSPRSQLVGSLLLASHRRMHAMDGHSLAISAWALTAMGVRPSARWLDRFQAAAFQEACQVFCVCVFV